MSKERLACVVIPDFSLELYYRRKPTLTSSPLALTEGDRPAAKIVILNRQAEETGVITGMTAAQAHILCPELIVKTRDHEREAKATACLTKKLQTIGPLVEQKTPGIFFMEAAGLRKLYRSETKLAGEIVKRVAAFKLPVKVGLAQNKFIARVSAQTSEPNNHTLVASGAEKSFIENLEVNRLSLSQDAIDKLHDLGLKKLGQLAAFPANELTARFGVEGTMLGHLAHGQDPEQFVRKRGEETLSDNMFLTYRIHHSEAILAHTVRILEPLLKRLIQTGRGCDCIELSLHLEDRQRETLAVSIACPTFTTAAFVRQLRYQLGQLRLRAGVVGLTVTVPVSAALPTEQLSLDRPAPSTASSHRHLNNQRIHAVTFNRALLPEQTFNLSPIGTKNKIDQKVEAPERRFNSGLAWLPDTIADLPQSRAGIGGLRLIQPPLKTQVTTENGLPIAIKSGSGAPQTVACDAGPWELSGGWWDADFDRLYYELRTRDKRQYLFFFDRRNDNWFLQGIFD